MASIRNGDKNTSSWAHVRTEPPSDVDGSQLERDRCCQRPPQTFRTEQFARQIPAPFTLASTPRLFVSFPGLNEKAAGSVRAARISDLHRKGIANSVC